MERVGSSVIPGEIQEFFEDLAVSAAAHCIQDDGLVTQSKADGTPVTNIDLEVDGYIIDAIKTAFPGVPILTEESKDDLGRLQSDYCFIVDPIDGTAALRESKGIREVDEFIAFVDENEFSFEHVDNKAIVAAGFSPEGVKALLTCRKYNKCEKNAVEEFKKRITEYSILLGLAHKGRSICGVCYIPKTDELYSAALGQGAKKICNGITVDIHSSGKRVGRVLVG